MAVPGQSALTRWVASSLLIAAPARTPWWPTAAARTAAYTQQSLQAARHVRERALGPRGNRARERPGSAPRQVDLAGRARVRAQDDSGATRGPSPNCHGDVAERQGRLRRTNERIAGLVRFIFEGDTSKAFAQRWRPDGTGRGR